MKVGGSQYERHRDYKKVVEGRGVTDMAQGLKALASKPDSLISAPHTHIVEEQN